MKNKSRRHNSKPGKPYDKSNNNFSKGKNYKAKEKDDRFEQPGGNDPSWYADTPEILRDAASIPFSWSVGTPIDINMPTTFPNGLSVPGIMTLNLIPSVGYSDSPTSPINVASTANYSFIRHANSGHSNYDSPDLTLYLLAMGQVYMLINWLMRIYSIATLYSQRNRYLPVGLLHANWVNPVDLQTNLARFRYGVNVLIHKCASLAIPNNMKYFKRSAFVYQNIYSEGDSIKDQLYMYVPTGFWKFQLDDAGAGMLKYRSIAPTTEYRFTVDGLLELGNELLNPILGSEDMNIMSGDVLKAYGPEGIMKLTELPEEYPIVPVFNIAVLEQFKNATMLPKIEMATRDIKQSADKSHLVHTPLVSGLDTELINANHLLTTGTYLTSPELVMENTRFMTGLFPSTEAGKGQIHGATELVQSCIVWTLKQDGSVGMRSVSGMISDLPTISSLSSFKYHPMVIMKTTDTPAKYYPFYDIDNFAVLDNADVARLNEAALLSLFNVPSIAKINRS